MSNNSILLLDPSFEPSNSVDCNLLIKIGLDSFSYAIINNNISHVNAVFDEQECVDVLQKFTEKLQSDYYLKLDYKEIKVVIYSPNIISIPSELYTETAIASHIPYFTNQDFGNIYTQQQGNYHNIYAFDSQLENLIKANFPSAKYYHLTTCVLALGNTNENQLLIDFTVGTFTVIYHKNGDLIFQQTYEIGNVAELNYYLLLIIQQLNIPLDQTKVQMSGIINLNDEKHKVLQQYFKESDFAKQDPSLNQEVLDDMPAHYYTSLLALNECE